ncbi:Metal-dependent membrane protease, CAAX family [Halanaeroarchaeum sp. HSR-CO]|uniref:CPBP family intramembrane glutamic endopeptidase n=1 Tax=Halanaeroarchaeum sp. HSR-CO TaxID=2866382 RepID=UPI00217DF41C|nr:CPBP family intramembrane glutamic endopeptidase [Halanaeroarchaeum sp. HSR-CO]UWG47253.1 Metal-dependent membrane protease, CAAX family [Halanaeroarchaeum sp. HSR-CO]
MTRWLPFLALLLTLTIGVVVLARSSAEVIGSEEAPHLGGRALRWNVVVSQGLVAVIVLAVAWFAGVPLEAFGWRGFAGVPAMELASSILGGVVLGAAIALGNVLLERVVDAPALREAEAVRRLLAPASPGGWGTLLLVVVPTIAIAEELLFRGALIGALAVGFEISPWVLAVLSSVAFGAAHSAQGAIGVVVTGVFGLVLAAAFVLTGDLLVVIVAHGVVDAVEFVVHEGPLSNP